jgi:hypothetical protein
MSRRCLVAAATIALLVTVSAADEKNDTAITPKETIKLFNGKDLTGLYTWLGPAAKGEKPLGKNNDPKKVFSVVDGTIRVAGMPMGYLATEKAYENYHLVVEYKWGKEVYGAKGVRNSGVLLNGTGIDGASGGFWMGSIECQLAQGCIGDLIPIRGKTDSGDAVATQFTSEAVLGADKHPRWKKGGEARVFKGQQWWEKHQEFFKEDLDARGKNDVDSPLGEWTKIEVFNVDKRITIKVNGTTVNECYDAVPGSGKILLQSEGFEIYFRNFELHPVSKK